jgi:GNAT superfamily N-acetyltransferase
MSLTSYPYHHRLPDGLVVCSSQPEHAAGLEQLQTIVFPTLADEQRFKAAHYVHHIQLFPQGQMTVLDGQRVVGMTTTIRSCFDFEHPDHTFAELIGGGWLPSHQPQGDWLYGLDIGTHPEYRRRGIARALYVARHEVARQLGLRGQITVGMLSGYGARKHEMSAESYYARVIAGELVDPTVSMQMKMGFVPRGLLCNYLDDPVCDGYGATLVLDASQDVAP